MKKLSYLIAIVVVMGAFASCSQSSSNHNVQGNWNVDSINAVNVDEYADFMSQRDQKKFDQRKKQMESALDTTQDEERKKQLETALKKMKSQKEQISAENYKQRIVKQNEQSQDKFTMTFAADSSFMIVSEKQDTVQQGTWEKGKDAIITHMQQGQMSDTLEIKSYDGNKMKLLQTQNMGKEFTLNVHFYLTKEKTTEEKS